MNILFTCAGRRTYLLKYFKDNLSEGDKVVAVDIQLTAPALQVADVKIQVPSVYDPDYIKILLAICKEYMISVLIPLNDLELPVLAQNKLLFEKTGVVVLVSAPPIIDLCSDKYKTAKWLESLGLNVPKTYIRLEDVKKALILGEVNFPLFLKPRWGSGSIGLEKVEDMDELDIYYHLLLKRIKKTILATASVGKEYVLIQEMLKGDEFGLDVVNDLGGNFVSVSAKKKLAMRAGETDKAVTVNEPYLSEIGSVIGTNLKHIGNLDVDIMQRGNGEYCVIELNPRFGGGFPFSYEAGMNLPLAIIQWIKGEKVSSQLLQPEYGRIFSKNDYLIEIK